MAGLVDRTEDFTKVSLILFFYYHKVSTIAGQIECINKIKEIL
jgi:hypothetical protein